MQSSSAVVVGNHTQGLGIVRSAGVAGYTVWMLNEAVVCLGRFSKYLAGYRRVRHGTFARLDQAQGAEHLLQQLLELPVEYPAVLFPVNEDVNVFIYSHREQLRAKYVIPDTRIDLITDKYQFNGLLPDSAQVETWLWSEWDAQRVTASDRFILKGRQGSRFRQITGRKALPLDRLAQTQIDRLQASMATAQVIVQRIVETDRPVLSVCSLAVDGQIQRLFQYEKIRQHPDRFGTGTYLRSTRVDSVIPLAAQILYSLHYTGISEIECMFDSATRTYKVLEMNPRTWKSVHFATQCEQNLVAHYLAYTATGQIVRGEDYTLGCYWADLSTDLPQMVRERRPFSYTPGFFECIWDWADPLPAVALGTFFPLMCLERLYGKFARRNGAWEANRY